MKSIELDGSMLRNLKPREAASHKGTYGKVAVIAGSKTMVGAATFAALSAYRTGSGIVKIVTESGNEMALFALVPEALVVTYEREMKAFSKVENELVDVIRWSHTLKGSVETVITAGETTYVNRFGNPGMATAGSGDVLAGIIASLLGQGYEAEMCAIIGVLIHSMAGDLAKRKFGEYSLLARDIIDSISEILKGI